MHENPFTQHLLTSVSLTTASMLLSWALNDLTTSLRLDMESLTVLQSNATASSLSTTASWLCWVDCRWLPRSATVCQQTTATCMCNYYQISVMLPLRYCSVTVIIQCNFTITTTKTSSRNEGCINNIYRNTLQFTNTVQLIYLFSSF